MVFVALAGGPVLATSLINAFCASVRQLTRSTVGPLLQIGVSTLSQMHHCSDQTTFVVARHY